MDRRRFLALTGAAINGLWISPIGLVELPRMMVVAISGRCSICSKPAGEVIGLAGVTGRKVRICNECIDSCLEILRDNLLLNARHPPLPMSEVLLNSQFLLSGEDRLAELLRRAQRPSSGAELRATLDEVQKLLEAPTERWKRNHGELTCSFCYCRQSEVGKLLRGLGIYGSFYICDVCIGDAAALIRLHS